MKKSGSVHYRINPEIASRELKGQLLFLRPVDRHLYTTNETGRFIWRQLVRRTSVDKMIALFEKEFGLTGDAAAKDVRRFLSQLEKKRIIERVAGH
jgi:hypothetical protein